jgi:ABC-type bacteriocin/lantibiotic exporter with double-glycine peptidase domain
LELGKVFSTLTLLGYIFNFSVLYSNWAIEALNSLKVFQNRISEVITSPFEESTKNKVDVIKIESGIVFENASFSWKPNAS